MALTTRAAALVLLGVVPVVLRPATVGRAGWALVLVLVLVALDLLLAASPKRAAW